MEAVERIRESMAIPGGTPPPMTIALSGEPAPVGRTIDVLDLGLIAERHYNRGRRDGEAEGGRRGHELGERDGARTGHELGGQALVAAAEEFGRIADRAVQAVTLPEGDRRTKAELCEQTMAHLRELLALGYALQSAVANGDLFPTRA